LEQNPSFVFFEPRAAAPVTGSAGIPLLPMASVAGDRTIFPMGTPILAEVPLLNADGTWSGAHQLRLLIVLDTGGAVQQNHLDLYHGMEKKKFSTTKLSIRAHSRQRCRSFI
ncbi:3D domain-containing protein, partial [Vibrio vulnificus]|uniref:3D domain-containing protein n=1 Tax=Vibrio vulnificus TaxID=672 RepID=UPI0032644440